MIKPSVNNIVNYRTFFNEHTMIWNKQPHVFYDAPFIGNGVMGAMFYTDKKTKEFILRLGNTRIYDNRKANKDNEELLFLSPRLPIGEFRFNLSEINKCNMSVDIYDAVSTGEFILKNNKFKFCSFTPQQSDVVFFDYEFDEGKEIKTEFCPSKAVSPRYAKLAYSKPENMKDEEYQKPKEFFDIETESVKFHIQAKFSGGYYATAYKTVKLNSAKNRLIIAIDFDDNKDSLIKKLIQRVNSAENNYSEILEYHKQWWHSFYKKSFLTLDDIKIESFFYIQLYKLASAGRKDGKVYDTAGPWLPDKTNWPGTWWNLNVELTYSPLYTSNHLEIAESLIKNLNENIENLINNVPEKYRYDSAGIGRCSTENLTSPIFEPGSDTPINMLETGNLTWALYCVYVHYKMSMDKSILKNTLYPLLKRTVNYYIHFLYLGEDNKLHLPKTTSPEYPESGCDCNYDLSLLKWGLKTLLEICKESDACDELEDKWKLTLSELTDYPQDTQQGFYIADSVKYGESHRHYSHLLMLYPLHNLDISDNNNHKIAETSINYWQSKSKSLQGYSQSGAASMYAMLGDGNKALKHLNNLWKGFIKPNTMYEEAENPVIETPPSAAAAVLDMIIQSFDGYINIFPAVPNKWKNITFDGMLAYDGFEVGAQLRDGKLQWVKVKSNSDKQNIKIKAGFEQADIVKASKEFKYDNGIFEAEILKGETIVLYVKDNITVSSVKHNNKKVNCYGLNKRNRRI